ncbi:MAG: DUF1667 domain-containing protein [Candidatus Bipolaricaulota bacterium]|nr:MAG: DUF1667 domain-containing protein [Candidatus Bipolaricaulota bacterium]
MACILCPSGCELDVRTSGEPTADSVVVEGNLCPRGEEYALEELLNPRRTLTTTVLVRGGVGTQTSVKTAAPVPRESLAAVRAALLGTTIDAPVAIGDRVAEDVAGTGVDVVATRAIPRRSDPVDVRLRNR